jgi:hypothetical protein
MQKKNESDDCAAVKLVEEKRLRAGQAELTGQIPWSLDKLK